MACFSKRAWRIPCWPPAQSWRCNLEACVLCGSETWSLYTHLRRCLNAFHMYCQKRNIVGITWHNQPCPWPGKSLPGMFTLLTQPGLQWLGHVTFTDDWQIKKRHTVRWAASKYNPALQGNFGRLGLHRRPASSTQQIGKPISSTPH